MILRCVIVALARFRCAILEVRHNWQTVFRVRGANFTKRG